MTLTEMVARLRIRLNDTQSVEFSDTELEDYIADAIQAVHAMRIQLGDSRIIKSATVTTTLPADWAAWVGQVPLKVTGTTVTGGPQTVRYFASATIPSAGDDTLDVPTILIPSVLNYAVLQGRLRLGLDIDQESPMTQKIFLAVASALGLQRVKPNNGTAR